MFLFQRSLDQRWPHLNNLVTTTHDALIWRPFCTTLRSWILDFMPWLSENCRSSPLSRVEHKHGGKKNELKIQWSNLWSVGNTTGACQDSILFYFWLPRWLHSSSLLKLWWLREMWVEMTYSPLGQKYVIPFQEFLALSSIKLDPT